MSVGRGTAGPARSDDELRFAELYDRCRGAIVDYCRRRVAADDVDDAVAETFLAVWRRIDDVPTGAASLVWTYGVAYRVVGHHWRGAARQRRVQGRLRLVGSRPAAAADELSVDRDECRVVLAALGRLGETDAEVLRLATWEEFSVADIAAVLGIAPNAVRQRLHRAHGHLAREYERLQAGPTASPASPTGGVR